jgi:1-acyl-sn-glycerol-3-phosphate acyltransferase
MTLLRSAAFYLALVPLTIYYGTVATLAAMRDKHRIADRAGQGWAAALLRIAGVDVEVTGTENIPDHNGLVVIANHISNFDPLVQFLALKDLSIRYMAKKELYKIPVFRTVIKSMNMVRVDRQAGAAGVAELKKRLALVFENGHTLAVFPEGTRSRTGEILDFKKGPFMTARSGDAEVLPITIVGTDRCWEPGDWRIRPGQVKVVIHPLLQIDHSAEDETEDLRIRTQEVIRTSYDALTLT